MPFVGAWAISVRDGPPDDARPPSTVQVTNWPVLPNGPTAFVRGMTPRDDLARRHCRGALPVAKSASCRPRPLPVVIRSHRLPGGGVFTSGSRAAVLALALVAVGSPTGRHRSRRQSWIIATEQHR